MTMKVATLKPVPPAGGVEALRAVESRLSSYLAGYAVFACESGPAEAEIQVQNRPGRQPALVRILVDLDDALFLEAHPNVTDGIAADLHNLLAGGSPHSGKAEEMVVDLRDRALPPWRRLSVVNGGRSPRRRRRSLLEAGRETHSA